MPLVKDDHYRDPDMFLGFLLSLPPRHKIMPKPATSRKLAGVESAGTATAGGRSPNVAEMAWGAVTLLNVYDVIAP